MSAGPWLVPVTSLRRHPGTRRHEVRSGIVGELRVASSKVPSGAVAVADALLDSVQGGIEVIADVVAPWEGECRRCLRSVSGSLSCHVRELFRPACAGDGDSESDEDTYHLRGEILDLQPLVRDALLLELPLAPLCSEDCKGLCAVCGADLNTDDCGCPPAGGDPRWGVLDVLRTPHGEG